MIKPEKRRQYTVALAMAVLTALPTAAWAQSNCMQSFNYKNVERYVYGTVATECPGGIHSAPFGNWGVDSYWGVRYDGFQFPGWYDNGDDWLEWNSCTTHVDFDAPDCDYFNHDSCTTQYSAAEYTYAVYATDVLPWGCTDGTVSEWIYTVGSDFMTMYELDPASSDTEVAEANYPSMNVLMSGSGGVFAGSSSAVSPTSVTGTWGANLTAKRRAYVEVIEW